MAEHQSTLQKAEEAKQRGELWRAKEILQGRQSSAAFEPEVHAALGRVLLEMQDTLEAGRHLFVSGSREAEAGKKEAIELYLSRHGSRDGEALKQSFPGPARRAEFHSLPEVVQGELLERGFIPAESRAKSQASGISSKPFSGLFDGLILLALFLALGVGFVTIFQKVSGWLS